MKIAYLIPGSGVSGGIAVICQHANRLQKRGHDVYLISEVPPTSIEWFPNQKVPIIGLKDFPNDLDILIATGWSTSFHVADLQARYKFYFVQSDERRFHPEDSDWYHITTLSYLLNFKYFTEAKWIQKWLLEDFGHKAELIANGLDPELFHPAKPYIPKTRKPRILLEGSITLPYKGMDLAFEVVRELDAEVWCVSSHGRPKPGWKVNRFFEQIDMTDMKHIYSSCDILLKLSRVEGFPCPPMEMMACGGVCVVGDVKGYDEYIVPDYNALVVDPFDIEGARIAIKRILSDRVLRQTLIRNGFETAKRWQWEPSVDLLEKYFKLVTTNKIEMKTSKIHQSIDTSISYFYHHLRADAPKNPIDLTIQRIGTIKWFRTLVAKTSKLYNGFKIFKRYIFEKFKIRECKSGSLTPRL